MSAAEEFLSEWARCVGSSPLPAQWQQNVRISLLKHRRLVADLRVRLQREEVYVDYLERVLADTEPQDDESKEEESAVEEKPQEDVRRSTDKSLIKQCISEISSDLNENKICSQELAQQASSKSTEQPETVAAVARPASQIVGDFVTVIEVNGMKADGKPKSNDESSATSSPIEISASKKKIPPRPPPKVLPKRGSSLPEPEDSPPTSLSNKLQESGSRESLASHSSSLGTSSIAERVKSYESINFLSSEHKKGNHTPPSTAAISDSLEEVEAGGNSKSASISLESIPGAIANEAKEEPYYDSVPLDTNDGEYVYIQAGGTSSNADTISNTSTLPMSARAPTARLEPPESPGNNSNYVNIDYYMQHRGTFGSQRSGSADSDGDGEGVGFSVDTDAPILFRSISTGTEAGHLAGSHTPISMRKSRQEGSVGDGDNDRPSMQRHIIMSIIKSETDYVECLAIMEKCMFMMKATLNSSQQVTEEEFNTIFYKIPELNDLHKNFLDGLKLAAQQREEPLYVGAHFKKMAENLHIYGAFLHNYSRATDAVRKCSAGSNKSWALTRNLESRPQIKGSEDHIKPISRAHPMSLEDLLHKPVARVQKNSFVLQDLLKYTPASHPDHAMLTDALNMTQHFLDEFNIEQTKSMFPNIDRTQRTLVKNSFIVELVDGHRKLRHLFLANDVIACAKYKALGRDKITFEVKWHIPLPDIVIYEETAEEPKETSPANIVVLKSQACTLRDQILFEEKTSDDKKIRIGKVAEKLRKKLRELEIQLVLASPNLVFRVGSKSTQKVQTFFLSSDYERTQWIDSIHVLQGNLVGRPLTASPLMAEIQAFVTAWHSSLNTDMSSYLTKSMNDESLLLGDLHLNIGEIMRPLDSPADLFVCVEVDSFGHYFRKAKTHLICHSNQPKWNETFVIELEGSQNVRVLLYEDSSGVRSLLRGKSILKLSREWLGEQQCHRTLSLSNISLSICMRFVPSEVSLRRVSTAKPGALFGAKIVQVCKRQKRDIPFIITSCVREVERRGMTEVGIYRVSGSASDLNRLKKSFETNSYEAEQLLKEVDIHSVTGILKLYLRELPEALFTDSLYPKFHQAYNSQGSGSDSLLSMGTSHANRLKELQTCFLQLPDNNKKCIDFILNHLIRVNQHESDNKMSLHNLATVFGPTLLRPSIKVDASKQRDLLAAGTVDVMDQAGILYCFLQQRQIASKTQPKDS